MEGCDGEMEWRGVMERWNGGMWWRDGMEGCDGEMEWRGVMERWNGGV